MCSAYLDHYRATALAVVEVAGVRRVLSKAASEKMFGLLSQDDDDRAALVRLLARPLLGASLFRGEIERARYLNVGHTALEDPRLAAWIAANRLRAILFVHDLIPLSHPEYSREGEDVRHARRMRTVLESAAGVIVNSRATRDALASFAVQCALPLPPTVVAWLGTSPMVSARTEIDAQPRARFVMLGTIDGRKNHALLLDVWSGFASLGADAPLLEIIGRRGWRCDSVFDRLDHDARLRGLVVEHSGLDDANLGERLDGTRALLFPSHVEGYGLPLVEALGRGLPVIASDLPIFRELAGDIPDYLATDDRAGWSEVILAYAQDDSVARGRQLARLTGYVAPSWDQHFARVDTWLDDR